MILSILKWLKKIWTSITHNFIFIGIASFFWLLYKTGTKPSRITYPCQQVALSNVGFLVYLLPAFYINGFMKLSGKNLTFRTIFKAVITIGIIILVINFMPRAINKFKIYQSYWKYEKSDKGPFGLKKTAGTAAGVLTGFATIPSALALPSPHRVVSVHDSNASSWEGGVNESPHGTFNQAVIDAMVAKGVMELTGKNSAQEAWAALIPYKADEAVAIKLNFNNDQGSWTSDHYMNPYAELIKSIIAGLNSIGIPSDRIWLTDPSRVIPDSFRTRVNDPNVRYFVGSTLDIGGRTNVQRTSFVAENSSYSSVSQVNSSTTYIIRPAQVFVDAHHIINVPQLKGHGDASITLGLKNHFGSIFINNAQGGSPLHNYFFIGQNTGSTYNLLADISNNPIFKNKTRLIIGDGLMGNSTINYQPPHVWTSFNGNPPETLFFGVDPVAVDSVMTDYLNRENTAGNQALRNDNILRYAASIGLGVFERWKDVNTRNYSGTGIDYVEVDIDTALCKNCSALAVKAGQSVNAVILGTNCGTNTVDMEYYDVSGGVSTRITDGNHGLPSVANFSNGRAVVSWTAQWFKGNSGGDPEIQFTASCGKSSSVSNILKIIK